MESISKPVSIVNNTSLITSFTIRVYGILMDRQQRVLVSDEYIRGNYFTKFPGGGLEFGEGTRECLQREFKEETNLDVTIGKHIYTTDYFQPSAFKSTHQMIGVYYYVESENPELIKTSEIPFNFTAEQKADKNGQYEAFRWIAWKDLNETEVHLPIDKIVVRLIKNNS